MYTSKDNLTPLLYSGKKKKNLGQQRSNISSSIEVT